MSPITRPAQMGQMGLEAMMAEQAEKTLTPEELEALEARRLAWVQAVNRRTIELNDGGWWAARLNGVLVLMRRDLGELMDALEAPAAARP